VAPRRGRSLPVGHGRISDPSHRQAFAGPRHCFRERGLRALRQGLRVRLVQIHRPGRSSRRAHDGDGRRNTDDRRPPRAPPPRRDRIHENPRRGRSGKVRREPRHGPGRARDRRHRRELRAPSGHVLSEVAFGSSRAEARLGRRLGDARRAGSVAARHAERGRDVSQREAAHRGPRRRGFARALRRQGARRTRRPRVCSIGASRACTAASPSFGSR